MAKLFPSTSITTPICKLNEIDGAFAILGGQIYLSSKVTVVPFSFLPLPASSECESTLKRYTRIPATSMTYGEDTEGLVIDYYAPNTSYVVQNCNDVTRYGITKIIRDINKYYKMGSYSPGTIVHDLQIIGQDEKYLYIQIKNQQTATYANYSIYKVNKSDMTYVSSVVIGAAGTYMNAVTVYPKLIAGKIYGAQMINASGKVNFFSVDVSTMTVTNYPGSTVYTNVMYTIGDIFEKDGLLNMYVHLNTNNIVRFTFNLQTNTLSESIACSFDYTRTTSATGWVITKCVPVNKSSIVLIQKPMRSETSILDSRVASFKINTDGTLTLVNAINLGVNLWKTYMFSVVDSLLFLCGSSNVDVISLSTDTDFTLRKLSSIPVLDLHTFARDSYGRYYLINKDTSFDFFNPEIPIAFEVTFDKAMNRYTGLLAKVSNTLYVKMYNHLGNTCSGTLRITLVGPSEFTDGLKTKDITVNGTVSIPFYQTGTGITSVKIKNL